MQEFNKFTLLLVDDDETFRNIMAFDFKRKGFKVLTAENGSQAFEAIKENKVDLVISDMRMPDCDGMGLLENMKKHNLKNPQIIFLTGFSEITEADCIARGAKKVLSKPFNRSELMSQIMELLNISTQARAA